MIADYDGDHQPDVLIHGQDRAWIRPLRAPSTSKDILPYVPDVDWSLLGD